MAVWSSLFKTIPHNCYELGHTWTPSCREAYLDLIQKGFKESFKVYGILYLVASIVRRKKKQYYVWKYWQEVLRSTTFLAVHVTLYCASFCFWRKIFPFYFYLNTFVCVVPCTALAFQIERPDRKVTGWTSLLTSGYLTGFTASFLSIIIERKSRRGLLAVYFLNLAVETLFRMAVSRGLVTPIKHGEVLLFSIVSAFYMYFFKKENGLDKSMKRMLKAVIGNAELPPSDHRLNQAPITSSGSQPLTDASVSVHTGSAVSSHRPASGRRSGLLSYLPKELQALLQLWRKGKQHSLCRHRHSCLSSSVEAALRMFGVGYCIQGALKLARALTSIVQKPQGVWDALKHKDNLALGLFLGGYCGIFRMVNCLLRWLRNEDSSFHGIISGFLAGWSMMFYKSVAVSMYLTSKLAETLYLKGIEANWLPYIKHGDTLVYSLSCALVLHAGIFEPQNLRPAYYKFMMQVSGQRFKEMNRKLLDVFGTKASTLEPYRWPDYDYRYTPNLKPPPGINL